MICILMANQMAIAQIDSGSHYTVISMALVKVLGL